MAASKPSMCYGVVHLRNGNGAAACTLRWFANPCEMTVAADEIECRKCRALLANSSSQWEEE